MPCRDGGRYDDADTQDRLDTVTRLLCELCKITDEAILKQNEELWKWWLLHQIEDARRLAAERQERERQALIMNALSKLTDAEKQALNIMWMNS